MATMRQDSSDPTGVAADKPSTEVVRARDRKANAALQLRVEGEDWQTIAEIIGYPTARAAIVATEQALEKELRQESKDALRQLAAKRLDKLLRSVWKKATDDESPEHLPAVGRARELIGDYRKLHGLDAATEINVHTPQAQEIEQWVAAMAQAGTPQLEEADIFSDDMPQVFDIEVVEDESSAVPSE